MYPISNSQIVPYSRAAAASGTNSSSIQHSSSALSFSSSSTISSSSSAMSPVVTPSSVFVPSAPMPIPMMPVPWMMYPPMPPMVMPYMPMPMMSMPFAQMPCTFFPYMFPWATSNSVGSSQVRNEMDGTSETTEAVNLLLGLSKSSEEISPSGKISKNASSTSSIQQPPSDVSMDFFAILSLDFEYGTARDNEGDLVPEKVIIKKQKLSKAVGAPVGNTLVMPTTIASRRDKSIRIFNKAIQFIKDCASLGPTPSWENYYSALKKMQNVEKNITRETLRKGKQLILLSKAALKKEDEMRRELSIKECRQFLIENGNEILGVKHVKISPKDFPDFMKEARKHKNELLDFQIPDNPKDSKWSARARAS